MSDLPEGWTMQPLGKIADCRLGKMLDAGKNLGELRPYLRNTNVQWGKVGLSDIKEMRIEDHERDRYAVRLGDLLVCEGGEPGRCAVWRDDREMYLQKALHRVRPLNGTSADYLRWFLQHATTSGALENFYTGSTIKHLPGRQLAQIPVPTPPPDEQRRIAEWLDEVDARRASIADRLAAGRAIVDRLRTALLAAACSGRLTADWRQEHPDATAGTVPSSPTSTEVALDVPARWARCTLEDIANRITSGPRDWSPYYNRGSSTFVMAQNVRPGRLDWSFHQAIDPPADDPGRRRCQIEVGDILVTIVGANTGDVAPVLEDRAKHFVCQSVALVRPPDGEYAPYLSHWFNSVEHGRRYFEECMYGAGRPHLSFEQLRKAPIAIPPAAERREIVTRVAAALNIADRLDASVSAAEATLDAASRASMFKAFRSELMPPEADQGAARNGDQGLDAAAAGTAGGPSAITGARLGPAGDQPVVSDAEVS